MDLPKKNTLHWRLDYLPEECSIRDFCECGNGPFGFLCYILLDQLCVSKFPMKTLNPVVAHFVTTQYDLGFLNPKDQTFSVFWSEMSLSHLKL
jgi:hypothetical protein